MPARYALTVGEFAKYINKEKNMNCDLTVVPCEGWKRDMYFEQTGMPLILPSPNLPTVNAFINYFATCYFEGTPYAVQTLYYISSGKEYVRGLWKGY